MTEKEHFYFVYLSEFLVGANDRVEVQKYSTMQMVQPTALRPEIDSLNTTAEPTITTTLLAVLVTEFVNVIGQIG